MKIVTSIFQGSWWLVLTKAKGAWRGQDLEGRPDAWIHHWTEDQKSELVRALELSRGIPRHQITTKNFPLPKLSKFVEELREKLENGLGLWRARGLDASLPLEDLESLFWGLGVHLGEPRSQSALGETIYHVKDAGFGQSDARTRGPNSRRGLSFHTDRSDVIAFLCVRQAHKGGENLLASSPFIHNEILRRSPELLPLLYEPFTYKRHTVDHGNSWAFCQQPIFSFEQGHFAANIIRVLIERAHSCPEIPDLTKAQRQALDLLESIAREPGVHLRFRQEAGDMLIINNFTVLHSRTEFEDYQDLAKQRLLLRLWLSVPNSRPLHPLFASHYGSTEAGALRGGIHQRKQADS